MLGALVFCAVAPGAMAAPKPKPKPQPQVALPADLNDLSLRITALETLYEFDFTVDKLNALKTLA